ncbi:phage holin family protein [Streptomyces sp. NPDC059533]|uniref:phage holin family protein n=1 Tax=Streptomyces sp. NPDC059533 TaxID=3346858 RepID=UPI0036AF96C5
MSALEGRPGRAGDEPVGELVARASRQISEPAREEMQPARAEMTLEGRGYGVSGGLFGGAGLVGVLAAQALVAAAIAALRLVLPVLPSALIVGVVPAAVAAVPAAAGRKQVARAGTPAPEKTIDSVKADLADIKPRSRRRPTDEPPAPWRGIRIRTDTR